MGVYDCPVGVSGLFKSSVLKTIAVTCAAYFTLACGGGGTSQVAFNADSNASDLPIDVQVVTTDLTEYWVTTDGKNPTKSDSCKQTDVLDLNVDRTATVKVLYTDATGKDVVTESTYVVNGTVPARGWTNYDTILSWDPYFKHIVSLFIKPSRAEPYVSSDAWGNTVTSKNTLSIIAFQWIANADVNFYNYTYHYFDYFRINPETGRIKKDWKDPSHILALENAAGDDIEKTAILAEWAELTTQAELDALEDLVTAAGKPWLVDFYQLVELAPFDYKEGRVNSGNLNVNINVTNEQGTAISLTPLTISGTYNGTVNGNFVLGNADGYYRPLSGTFEVQCTDPGCSPNTEIYQLDSTQKFSLLNEDGEIDPDGQEAANLLSCD